MAGLGERHEILLANEIQTDRFGRYWEWAAFGMHFSRSRRLVLWSFPSRSRFLRLFARVPRHLPMG